MDGEKILRDQMAKDAKRISVVLTDLAERINRVSEEFANPNRPAAATVADIANEYTQGTGAAGPILWTMIRELGRTS